MREAEAALKAKEEDSDKVRAKITELNDTFDTSRREFEDQVCKLRQAAAEANEALRGTDRKLSEKDRRIERLSDRIHEQEQDAERMRTQVREGGEVETYAATGSRAGQIIERIRNQVCPNERDY